jgi:hypothetical protein
MTTNGTGRGKRGKEGRKEEGMSRTVANAGCAKGRTATTRRREQECKNKEKKQVFSVDAIGLCSPERAHSHTYTALRKEHAP